MVLTSPPAYPAGLNQPSLNPTRRTVVQAVNSSRPTPTYRLQQDTPPPAVPLPPNPLRRVVRAVGNAVDSAGRTSARLSRGPATRLPRPPPPCAHSHIHFN